MFFLSLKEGLVQFPYIDKVGGPQNVRAEGGEEVLVEGYLLPPSSGNELVQIMEVTSGTCLW